MFLSMSYKRKKVTNITRERIAASQSWRCSLCSCLLDETFQVDHRIPVSRGGKNDASNLQALCPSCHAHKTTTENDVRLQQDQIINELTSELEHLKHKHKTELEAMQTKINNYETNLAVMETELQTANMALAQKQKAERSKLEFSFFRASIPDNDDINVDDVNENDAKQIDEKQNDSKEDKVFVEDKKLLKTCQWENCKNICKVKWCDEHRYQAQSDKKQKRDKILRARVPNKCIWENCQRSCRKKYCHEHFLKSRLKYNRERRKLKKHLNLNPQIMNN